MPHWNRLVVYDFDGTIANVPERPSDWKGSDWWGHPDSLSEPHYDGGVNHEVVNSMKRDNADPMTYVMMLTGRRNIVSPSVRNVLRSQGLYGKRIIPASNKTALQKFQSNVEAGHDQEHPDEHKGHEEFYSGDHHTEDDFPKTAKGKIDGTTLAHKIYNVNSKVNGNTEVVEFWEDRADHIPHFVKLGLDLLKKYGEEAGGKLHSVILHRVYAPAMQGGQGAVQHIPIKLGMSY